MTSDDPAGLARAILDANPYMTLGTADKSGRPWVSPVYYAMTATGPWAMAEQLTGAELMRGIEVFSRRSVQHGARRWVPSDVRAPSLLRAYRATAMEQSVLDATAERGSERADQRIQVSL